MSKVSKKDRADAIDALHRFLSPGSTVYYTVRTVSRSGMRRTLDFYAVDDGRILRLTGVISRATGYNLNKRAEIVVGGCGFDAGFEVVYNLGATLWPKGTPEPHGTRNGKPDSAGGYALRGERL
jgi:hypothetical protein